MCELFYDLTRRAGEYKISVLKLIDICKFECVNHIQAMKCLPKSRMPKFFISSFPNKWFLRAESDPKFETPFLWVKKLSPRLAKLDLAIICLEIFSCSFFLTKTSGMNFSIKMDFFFNTHYEILFFNFWYVIWQH